jgi:glutathione peroxidase
MALFSFLSSAAKAHVVPEKTYHNAYAFEFQSLDGDGKIKLSDYQGKVIMVVNTASQCGFAIQYGELQELYSRYHDEGFIIIAVPNYDFGDQELGTPEEISKFCQINYSISFPLTTKYNVAGSKAHPFYVWAREQLGFGTGPKWNFHKYLIDRQGNLAEYFYTTTPPDAPRVIEAIEKLIANKIAA